MQRINQLGRYFRINYTYYPGGLLDNKQIAETDSFNNTKEKLDDIRHCYDNMDRLTEVSEYTKHQNGSVVSYSYDPIAQYEYDENSNIKTVSYDNGTKASYT